LAIIIGTALSALPQRSKTLTMPAARTCTPHTATDFSEAPGRKHRFDCDATAEEAE
jgi:hypothetical protein